MKLIKSKKGVAFLAVLAIAVISAVGAYAYFTSTGNGTGSATVGSATNWTVGQTGVTNPGPNNGLFPDAAVGGANIQTNAYHVKNGGSGSQALTSVVISVATSVGGVWTAQADALKPACNASDFSIDGLAVGTAKTDTALAGDFTAGQDKTTGSVTVELIDNGANQDNCQGVTVPLYFAAS